VDCCSNRQTRSRGIFPLPIAAAAPAPAENIPQIITSANTNYRGELNKPRNQNADIPEEENYITTLTNLPTDCTYKMLFGSMRNIGAINYV
jgi:hypothetical protein